jgi:hypothetical protein
MTPSKNLRTVAAAVVLIAAAAAGAAAGASKLRGGGHDAAAPAVSPGAFVDSSSSPSRPRFDRHGPGGPGRPHGGLDAAAAYLGISEDALHTQLEAGKTLAQIANAADGKSAAGLVEALVAAEKRHIEADVTSGRLTQAQADAILKDLNARVTARVDGAEPPRGPGGLGRHHGGLDAAATYLGVSEDELHTRLESGKTLAQIAEETSGKSRAGLVAALVAAEKAELAQAVQAGHLTQAQVDGISANLAARVADMVDHAPPARGRDRDHAPASA